MSRNARIVIADWPHHLTQRGNQRRQMFFSADDYLCYLALWQEYAGRFGVRLRGYCLMPNHVHMVPIRWGAPLV